MPDPIRAGHPLTDTVGAQRHGPRGRVGWYGRRYRRRDLPPALLESEQQRSSALPRVGRRCNETVSAPSRRQGSGGDKARGRGGRVPGDGSDLARYAEPREAAEGLAPEAADGLRGAVPEMRQAVRSGARSRRRARSWNDDTHLYDATALTPAADGGLGYRSSSRGGDSVCDSRARGRSMSSQGDKCSCAAERVRPGFRWH